MSLVGRWRGLVKKPINSWKYKEFEIFNPKVRRYILGHGNRITEAEKKDGQRALIYFSYTRLVILNLSLFYNYFNL